MQGFCPLLVRIGAENSQKVPSSRAFVTITELLQNRQKVPICRAFVKCKMSQYCNIDKSAGQGHFLRERLVSVKIAHMQGFCKCHKSAGQKPFFRVPVFWGFFLVH